MSYLRFAIPIAVCAAVVAILVSNETNFPIAIVLGLFAAGTAFIVEAIVREVATMPRREREMNELRAYWAKHGLPSRD